MLATRLLLLSILMLLCAGFEWPGRASHLLRELRESDPARQTELIRLLGDYPADQVREALLKALEDEDLGTRLDAAQAAQRVGIREAVPVLRTWLKDPEPMARESAARALGILGDASAVDMLTPLLSDSQPVVRRAAVEALGRIGGPAAAACLLERVEDADPGVRLEAIEALARSRDARALDPLLRAAQDSSAEIRDAALRALGESGDKRALDALIKGLKHESEETRLAAVSALGRLGDPDCISALGERLAGADARLGEAIAAALGSFPDQRATELLAAQHNNPELKQVAADSLAAQAERSLAGAPGDTGNPWKAPEEEPRPPATRAPGAASPALDSLIRLAQGDDPALAARAIDALASRGDARATAAVAGLTIRPPLKRILAATYALANFDVAEVKTLLRLALLKAPAPAAAAAAVALGELGNASDGPRLIKSARRHRWPAPAAAAYAIARLARRNKLEKKEVRRDLCELMREPETYLRANLAVAMAAVGAGACQNGNGPLEWLASRQAPVVRAAAARWARAAAESGALPWEWARQALLNCVVRDPEPEVVKACLAPALPPVDRQVDLSAYASDGRTVLRNKLAALRLADGSVLIAYSDYNGHLPIRVAPRGELLLEDPAAMH